MKNLTLNIQTTLQIIIFCSILLTNPVSSAQEYCVNLKSYQVCYFQTNEQLAFKNCTSQKCTQYTLDSEDCLHFDEVSYSESECSQRICKHYSIASCLFPDQQSTSDDQNDRLIKIYIGVAVSFICLVILVAICRKTRNKQRILPQTIVSNNNSHSSLQSLSLDQTLNPNHQNHQLSSIDNLTTLQHPNYKPLHKRKKTTSSTEKDNFAIFFQENNPENEEKNSNSSDFQRKICCICLSSDSIDCKTLCGHFYHAKCLAEWVLRKPQCPECRNKRFAPLECL